MGDLCRFAAYNPKQLSELPPKTQKGNAKDGCKIQEKSRNRICVRQQIKYQQARQNIPIPAQAARERNLHMPDKYPLRHQIPDHKGQKACPRNIPVIMKQQIGCPIQQK